MSSTASKTVAKERDVPAVWRRVVAGCIDLAIAVPLAIAIVTLGVVDIGRWDGAPGLLWFDHAAATFHGSVSWTFTQWLIVWTPLCALHGGFGTLGRRTPGALVAGLKVVGPDGYAASPIRGLIRGLAYLVWPATLLLAPLLTWVSPSQRGPVEWLSGTWVVRDPARSRSARQV